MKNYIRVISYGILVATYSLVLQSQTCKAVSLDGGAVNNLGTICAYNPGLSPSQVLQDTVAEGKVVVLIGASWCELCTKTMDAIHALCGLYPDIVFIYVNADTYKSMRTMRTIPELRLYKNGKLVQKTDSKNEAQMRALLNSLK